MKILAIDTTCMMGSVALLDGESVAAEQMLNVSVTHSERLIPSIEALLRSAGTDISMIDGFAVAIGPGSFTGLRIGLGAAKGFAFALDKPVAGVSSLSALAYNLFASEFPIVSLIDARRGEYYIAVNRFEGGKLGGILKDAVMPPDELLEYLAGFKTPLAFTGDGVFLLKDAITGKLGSRAVIPPPQLLHPRASNTAWLALARFKAGDADDLASLAPNYIRKSDAER